MSRRQVAKMQDSECLTLTIAETAELLGISRNLAYSLAKRDELPVKVIRLGERRMVVSRKALMALLDNENESAPSSEMTQQ